MIQYFYELMLTVVYSYFLSFFYLMFLSCPKTDPAYYIPFACHFSILLLAVTFSQASFDDFACFEE